MTYGIGQLGQPGQSNPGQYILEANKAKEDLIARRSVDRSKDYERLIGNQTPGFIGSAIQGAMGQLASIPGQISQSIQQSPEFKQVLDNPPKQDTITSNIESTPSEQPTPWSDNTSEKLKPLAGEFGASMAAMKPAIEKTITDKSVMGIENSINDDLTSEDPDKFTSGLEQFKKLEDVDLSPDTPAGQFRSQIDQKYLMAVDDKGNKVYECPLTKRPCGRKTFWDRLKTFFLSLTGKLEPKKVVDDINRFNKIDPISKSYESNQPQVKASNNVENPWLSQVHESPYSKGGML